jgi:hypothetical protein
MPILNQTSKTKLGAFAVDETPQTRRFDEFSPVEFERHSLMKGNKVLPSKLFTNEVESLTNLRTFETT